MRYKKNNVKLKAVNIQWDEDDRVNSDVELPKEIVIPFGMTDIEEISDYITATTGYLHYGFGLETYVVPAESQETAKPYYMRLHYAWETNADNDVFHAFEATDPNFVCNTEDMKEKMRVSLDPNSESRWGVNSMLIDIPQSIVERIQAEAIEKCFKDISAFELCRMLREKEGVVAVQMWQEEDIRNAFETELDISEPDPELVSIVSSRVQDNLEDCSDNWEKIYATLNEVMEDNEND